MSYRIRRWLSFDGNMMDDTAKAETADDAIIAAKRFAGIFQNVITKDIENRIHTMEPGGTVRIRKSDLKLTIRISRGKS